MMFPYTKPNGNSYRDPYWQDTKLLLPFRGPNGSTIVQDASLRNFGWTVQGNSVIDTSQSRYGPSSLYLDGNGDYLETTTDTAFSAGSGDYTWEFDFRLTGTQFSNDSVIMAHVEVGNNGNSAYSIAVSGSNTSTRNALSFYYYSGATAYTLQATGLTINFDQWYRVAFTKYSGNNLRMFLGGTKVKESALSGQPNTSSVSFKIGCLRPITSFQHFTKGWLANIRLTKGVARYSADYTPLAAAFPSV